MIAATETDLTTLAARLVEVFELEEFSAEAAKDIAGEGDLSRLVASGLICEQAGLFVGRFDSRVYTNQIPNTEAS